MTARIDPMIDAMNQNGWYAERRYRRPPLQYQVMGERGCGTNLVRKLVQRTFTIERSDALGWKHGFPTMAAIPERMLIICVQRAPMPWATSLYKRPWHAHPDIQALDFSSFIRAPWNSVVDRKSHFEHIPDALNVRHRPLQYDRHPMTGLPFANIFALRTAKARGLIGLRNRGSDLVFVKLEHVQADPEKFLTDLGEKFDLNPSERGYRPVTRRLGNRFKPAIENRPQAPSHWVQADIDHMSEQLTPIIESIFGY